MTAFRKMTDLPEKYRKLVWHGKVENARKKLSKYHSMITAVDDIKFHSAKEAKYYEDLKLLKKAGEVLYWIRQPMFDLGGGVTYKADFLVFWKDGSYTVVDVKGYQTAESKRIIKIVEAIYPIKVILV